MLVVHRLIMRYNVFIICKIHPALSVLSNTENQTAYFY